jgi:uncharacterized protein YjbJ (UPF0337 family)
MSFGIQEVRYVEEETQGRSDWWNFSGERTFFTRNNGEFQMDKDRIKGSAEQVKGKMKEVAGKVTGDSKLESERKVNQVKGKIQNTMGGIKDSLRGE